MAASGILEDQAMATAARDRLARTLRGDAQAAFSVELAAKADDLSLEVEGFGQVRFPVTAAKARKLIGLGRPARFGRGEETLTDPDVRDTWEIPKHLVRAQWDDARLKDILATVKEELGLPNAAELTADLHSLLVYETNQHFLAHQDSEKDDSMVGTLVVTLPSSYTGGELPRTGQLRAAGFPLLPSFRRPHYTIRLDGDDPVGLARLLDVFGPTRANKYHRRERPGRR
jgi:hypothetical protein